jgi:hypothetical protein
MPAGPHIPGERQGETLYSKDDIRRKALWRGEVLSAHQRELAKGLGDECTLEAVVAVCSAIQHFGRSRREHGEEGGGSGCALCAFGNPLLESSYEKCSHWVASDGTMADAQQ